MREPFNPRPMPKNEKHYCQCGANFKTAGSLATHVYKAQTRGEGKHHGPSHIMKNGTKYVTRYAL